MTTSSRSTRALIFVLAFALVLPVFTIPSSANAQSSSRYSRDRDDDRTSSFSYGRVSSSVRNKINKLDDDAVEKLPIPIVLGVAVRNLYPSFGDPRDGGSRQHQGLDIMAPMGAYIASPTEAVVTRTGTGETEGKYVYTANPGGETFAYMHLSDIADGVKAGTELKEGDLIGFVGDTGNAKGGAPHLHFEIRDGRTPTDPFPRLTHEFSAEIRIKVLKAILEDLLEQLEDAR